MKFLDTLLFGTSLIIIVLLVSCQLEIEPATTIATEKAQVETTSETVLVATTSSATVIRETPTPLPTVVTPTPTQTVLPTETVTATPWPTLLPNEAAERIVSLLADNQNIDCLLPCWWGATPGQTQWQDIELFLRSFAIKITESPKGALMKIPLPVPVAAHGFSYVGYGWDESGIIRTISVHSMNISGYDPKTMMTLYGIPDEVWLKTFDDDLPGDVLPFQLIIVYQGKGISFRYYVNAYSDGDTVTVCFEPEVIEVERPDLFPVGPRFYLWEPGQTKTIDEIANTPDGRYYPLEEKTDLTLQTFYEKFTNPNESPCIDTPAALWDE